MRTCAIATFCLAFLASCGCRSNETAKPAAIQPATQEATLKFEPANPADLPSHVPAVKVEDGKRLRLMNPLVKVDGKMIFLPTECRLLPNNIAPGFTVNEKQEADKYYLLRFSHGKAVQVVEVESFSSLSLVDLAGDGTQEVVTGGYNSPLSTQFNYSMDLEYSNGNWTQSRGGGGMGGEVFSIDPDGALMKLFDVSTGLGCSSLGRHYWIWADLYGDGRPVACQITEWDKDYFQATGWNPPTKSEITSYMHRDKATGKWIDDAIHLPVPDPAKDHLKGLLDPRHPNQAPLQKFRDQIRSVLPAGWTAQIDYMDVIRIMELEKRYTYKEVSQTQSREQLQEDRRWGNVVHGEKQSGLVTIDLRFYPYMSKEERRSVARWNKEIKAKIDAIRRANPDADLPERRTPQQRAAFAQIGELGKQLRPEPPARGDVETRQHLIAISLSSQREDDVFQDPGVATDIGYILTIITRVLSSDAASQPTTQPATAPATK